MRKAMLNALIIISALVVIVVVLGLWTDKENEKQIKVEFDLLKVISLKVDVKSFQNENNSGAHQSYPSSSLNTN